MEYTLTQRQKLIQAQKKHFRIPFLKYILFTIVILFLIAGGVYYIKFVKKSVNYDIPIKKDKNIDIQTEVITKQDVLNKLKKIVRIEKEPISIILINNKEKLLQLKKVNEDFVDKAQLGDYLILFDDSAYILRYNTDEIIAFAKK